MNISTTSPIQQVSPRIEPPVTQASAAPSLTEKAVKQIDAMKDADNDKQVGRNLDIKV